MTIILFLVVLAVLIFVHELGHFLTAKKSGIRVDEFAIGFPPKIFGWVRGETKYVLNLIPFGGYVKIFGENPDDDSIAGPDSKRSFVNAKKWKQVCVLISGVGMNIIFAWVLISISFMLGSLVPLGDNYSSQYSKYIKDSQVILTGVAVDSPAEKAGLKQGDRLLQIISDQKIYGSDTDPLSVSLIREVIEKSPKGEVKIIYKRNGELGTTTAVAKENETEKRKVIGIYMENVGIVRLNPFLAFWEGLKLTLITLKEVAVGLFTFIWQAIKGEGDLSQMTGPVGIVGMVGDAVHIGFSYLLGFVAFISLNLAVINLIPFPALDGGRVLFVIIEAIARRQIKPKVANIINTVGFFVLISLMVIVTYRDIMKFF